MSEARHCMSLMLVIVVICISYHEANKLSIIILSGDYIELLFSLW